MIDTPIAFSYYNNMMYIPISDIIEKTVTAKIITIMTTIITVNTTIDINNISSIIYDIIIYYII